MKFQTFVALCFISCPKKVASQQIFNSKFDFHSSSCPLEDEPNPAQHVEIATESFLKTSNPLTESEE